MFVCVCAHMCVYLCRLCTPPSIWADTVLFSNFRSPEYIIALRTQDRQKRSSKHLLPRLVHLHVHTLPVSLWLFVCVSVRNNVLLGNDRDQRLCVPKLREALRSYVLAGVLDPSMEVGDKLMDGAFVLYGARHALSYFDLITLAEKDTVKISIEKKKHA